MLAPIRHLIGSTRYSLQGVQVLVREMAARIEIGAYFIALGLLALFGAELRHWIVITVLFLILLAVEALNTAIEAVVDRVSPERSDFARDAKDLGSAGVFLVVLATKCYLIAAILSSLGFFNF